MARQMLGYPEPDVFAESDSGIKFLGSSSGDGSSENDNMPAATRP
jgi:hypothetical protein